RILFKPQNQAAREISKDQLFEQFKPGDVLVINDTRVEKRRVFAGELEIVFVENLGSCRWSVLFPAKKFKEGDSIPLPGGVEARILQKGLPQIIETSKVLTTEFFAEFGEPALPPYIQNARG